MTPKENLFGRRCTKDDAFKPWGYATLVFHPLRDKDGHHTPDEHQENDHDRFRLHHLQAPYIDKRLKSIVYVTQPNSQSVT